MKSRSLSQAEPPRRNFLRSTLIGSAAAMLPSLAGARERSGESSFASEEDAFELKEATIADLQQKMSTGQYTSRASPEMYLARIEAIDKNGSALNSVIEVNPDALAIAQVLDKERKEKGPRGSMHGIPVLIKDNIDTGDQMMTTAGSLALEGTRAAKDAFIVK